MIIHMENVVLKVHAARVLCFHGICIGVFLVRRLHSASSSLLYAIKRKALEILISLVAPVRRAPLLDGSPS